MNALEPLAKHKPIKYPKPDGVLTFDKLSSVFLSNTNHEEGPAGPPEGEGHGLQKRSEHDVFGGPSSATARPASMSGSKDGVYVINARGVRYQINAQNCVHCKTCDIKDPNQNINWVKARSTSNSGVAAPGYRRP
jgi:electron-transferring-flavoprotein dehydrogenase